MSLTDDRLAAQLIKHEGYRQFPYKDSVGVLTVAVGRNLEHVGISEDEANYLLKNDIREARYQCRDNFSWYDALDQVRKDALTNMCFNLGITRLKGFKKMLAAFARQDYKEAAKQALDSKWARQVGRRADDITHMIEKGTYP